ncbi:uncharacterized protein PHALS_01303 [Plasmopara halstedii]|uniref:Uncharacterized protein n=1 Tax=Plasmopara halstedii TaxID=4781 RepID=A0A0P1AWM1_PLAHL|nr:uncharacterized protein PHALS_01303 [Plasmopara halstedii]CEG44980.1 hypothetical protein PHALS_01303 [Plasmopara halstedii]|eukprot:XP_024581349.1 hypothetical protein PHALS_01303 [Plasmopara halstedii]
MGQNQFQPVLTLYIICDRIGCKVTKTSYDLTFVSVRWPQNPPFAFSQELYDYIYHF